MSLGEKGLEVGPDGNSQEEVVGNRAVYVNPVTSRLVRVKTSARVLELSEKSFETGLGNFSLKPTICYRVSDVRKCLENVEDADKFVTSWVLKDVGYFLATSANAQRAATGLQRDHLRFSSLVRTEHLQGEPDPRIASVQQPEYFRRITDDYGIEILWVEFRNTKHKMKRTWDVPETPRTE
ncbi:hypothetical protein ASPVEDRAFT_40279 [Aspergillus versicolor CBS 583.65]|uniref:Uncharacterized protein n=1 Tax=Aspergillus versicolor CBS 583.65 TaxID=1036611 RepID=A0A1L9PGU4_ASPVE|nr:uncharacterized protein ASPVEDRAFT_40279 [Aspergillus versicolor CBS 583.65]OJJ00744.1 hypothetical protein ASPVEDRAFT_40279 [Aspergillus versicolor CBS 583.65]